MVNQILFTVATMAVVLPAGSLAQTPPTAPKAQRLRGNVYWVKGGNGANTGFIVGTHEVIAIDAKTTEEACGAVLAEIARVTPLPVKKVVLTHSDGDHVGGLPGFPKGIAILAHPNSRRDMEEAAKDPKMRALASWLPNDIAPGDREIMIDGARLRLLHFGPAHTSGDIVVYVPRQKVAFIGDLAFLGRDPLIHSRKGGTSFGLVANLKKILALDADTFISGHNDPLTKADLRGLLASIEEKQAKVKALAAQGKSVADVRAAFKITDAPGRRWPSLVEVIYQDVTGRKQ
ncbi:MAG: MBL fold metallo-hydrolase [Acidobacteria bacterium]|nr:MBL fold metallo-hydrolase [Acidobacteriota bacterium]